MHSVRGYTAPTAKSQGVIPFLKVVNDTAVAVNQGGRRRGAVCCYLETWHLDIEEFLELRRNVGDDRRRTHDMNTANWVPDLFMKRVMENGEWTLFSPVDVPDLRRDVWEDIQETAYQAYEVKKAAAGEIKHFKESRCGCPLAQDALHDVRDRSSLDLLQGSLQYPVATTTCWRRAWFQSMHGNHAQYVGCRNRGMQSRFGEPNGIPVLE